MMALLRQLWRRVKKGGPAKTRPVFTSGERWDWAKWGCPGCGKTEIYEGPQGGACQNICCANQACQRAFNLGPAGITWDIGNQWFKGAFEPEPEKFGKWRDDELDSRKTG